MDIPLEKLCYSFKKKPLLVGGLAMEYYGLRKSGKDIDLIVPEEDFTGLIKLYPNRMKDLWGDLGVCPFEFEIWKTISYLNYDELKTGAIETEKILIISLEKLLTMKTLAIKNEKCLKDVRLIVEKMLDKQSKQYNQINSHNSELIREVNGIVYIEKTGPKE